MLTATPEEGRKFETYSLKYEGNIRIILRNVRRKGKSGINWLRMDYNRQIYEYGKTFWENLGHFREYRI